MLAYAAGSLPAGILLLAVATWLMRLYCPTEDEQRRTLLVSPLTFGVASSAVMFVAAVTDLLVGYWSDRTRTRWGRRRPFILFGTPILAISFLLLWFPPVPALSGANVVWLVAFLGLLHVSFTVVVNPYLALMPEVWRSDAARVRVSVWMAVFNTVAQVVAFAGFGVLISALSNGGQVLGIEVPDGFKVAAVGVFAVTLAGFLPTILWIRETPHSADKEVPFGLWSAALQTLKNPAFLPYIGAGAALYAAQFLIEAALPYLVVTQVVEDESQGDMVASLLLLGLVVVTAFLFPLADRLARRFRKADLFMASLASFAVVLPLVTLSGQIPGIPAMVQVVVSCLLIAPGLAIGLVIPRAILADIMDFDAQRTGFRREAMYNGMEGLLQKVAGGLAPLVQGALFSAFGYSRAEPWGIVACGVAGGLLTLLGMLAFRFYPLER